MKCRKVLLATICSDSGISEMQLALYYIKVYLEKKFKRKLSSLTVKIKTFAKNDRQKVIAKDIIDEKPTIIGFSCYVWNIETTLKVAHLIKKVRPQTQIVLGGPEAGPRAEALLRSEESIDIVVKGEGEEAFYRLVESLIYGNGNLEWVEGISFRGNNAIVSNPSAVYLQSLDSIPSPFLTGAIDLKSCDTVLMETMRGCPYGCRYCYKHVDGSKVRYFSLKRVDREFKLILSKKPKIVFILDPTFNLNVKRAKAILRIFIKYNLVSKLILAIKAELLDKEIIELFSKARIELLEIGLQSTNRKTLRIVNRTLQRNIFKKNIMLLRNKKIRFQLQLIKLLPYDTYESLKHSIDWACNLYPTDIEIFRFCVLPGTYFRQHANALGIKYFSTPPYFAHQSKAMSGLDLIKTTKLEEAIERIYNFGFIRNGMHVVKNKLKIPITSILEEWVKWIESYKKKNKQLFIKKDMPIYEYYELLGNIMPMFLKYLCNRYHKSYTYDSINTVVKDEIMNFNVALLKREHKYQVSVKNI